MLFHKTPLEGAYRIELEKKEDARGYFARSFCAQAFQERDLESYFVQNNTSLSTHKGTLRGLHYQIAPYEEVKIVHCISGAIYDVIVDVRKNSKTFGQFFGTILSQKNKEMLYVPKGCAHGFLTLEENSEVFYQVSTEYHCLFERGIRYNDPAFAIKWPCAPQHISDKDQKHPLFNIQEI